MGAPREVFDQLSARSVQHVCVSVDGGHTIQAFVAAGLIDETFVTRVPLMLGGGIVLFGALVHGGRLRM